MHYFMNVLQVRKMSYFGKNNLVSAAEVNVKIKKSKLVYMSIIIFYTNATKNVLKY